MLATRLQGRRRALGDVRYLCFAGQKARGPITVTVPSPTELRALVKSRHAEELEVPEGFVVARSV